MKKEMSVAFKAIDNHRDMMNKGRVKILAKDLSSACYLYDNNDGKPCVKGYKGRAKKPAFNFRYNTVEARNQKVVEWMNRCSEQSESQRENQKRNVNVGSILKAAWGYDQTNVDYYLVQELIGKTMVSIVEIGCMVSNSDSMNGVSVPDPTLIIGKPMRKKCNGEMVVVDSCRRARLMKPSVEIAGVDVYAPTAFSSTH